MAEHNVIGAAAIILVTILERGGQQLDDLRENWADLNDAQWDEVKEASAHLIASVSEGFGDMAAHVHEHHNSPDAEPVAGGFAIAVGRRKRRQPEVEPPGDWIDYRHSVPLNIWAKFYRRATFGQIVSTLFFVAGAAFYVIMGVTVAGR